MRQIALVAVLSAAALAACEKGDAKAAGEPDTTAQSTQRLAQPDPRVARADVSRIMGSPTATAWVMIVSDFQCPYCKNFQDERAGQITREYVETGKVRFAYVHFPLNQHANAMPAAEASMCAGAQDKFWPYHDQLFETVDSWGPATAPQATFESIATALGLDLTAFRQCQQDDVMLPMIQADYQRGVQAGVKSTPTFLIDKTLIPGVAPLDVFQKAINEALASGAK